MEILLFFLIVAFIVILFGGVGFALIWYGTILLKDKDSFLIFLGTLLILIGVFFVSATISTIATLLVVGLKN